MSTGKFKTQRERFDSSIKDILNLKDGWYDGDGKKFPSKKVKRFQKIMIDLLEDKFLPYVFPTTEGKKGTIEAEWAFARKEKRKSVILSVDMETMSATMFLIDLNEDEAVDVPVDLDDRASLEYMARKIEELKQERE